MIPPTKQQIREACLSQIDIELDKMLINITTEMKLRDKNIKALKNKAEESL